MNIICANQRLQTRDNIDVAMALRYSREEVLQRVMLSEDEDSESEISEFDVFDEANDMEGYRSVHDDNSGDRKEGSEEESNDDSNVQGTDYSITVNAVHTRLIYLIESGPSGSRAGVGCGRSRSFRRGTQLG